MSIFAGQRLSLTAKAAHIFGVIKTSMKKTITHGDLGIIIEKYVAEYPKNNGERKIWRKPLLATADRVWF